MKKVFAVFASVVLFALVGFNGVAANAATVERVVNPYNNHVIYSWIEDCTVTEVQHESNRDVVYVLVDGTDDIYSFYDIEKGYWKAGMKLKASFDLCVTCGDKYPELNSVIE